MSAALDERFRALAAKLRDRLAEIVDEQVKALEIDVIKQVSKAVTEAVLKVLTTEGALAKQIEAIVSKEISDVQQRRAEHRCLIRLSAEKLRKAQADGGLHPRPEMIGLDVYNLLPDEAKAEVDAVASTFKVAKAVTV